jgi:hypothetical protein
MDLRERGWLELEVPRCAESPTNLSASHTSPISTLAQLVMLLFLRFWDLHAYGF